MLVRCAIGRNALKLACNWEDVDMLEKNMRNWEDVDMLEKNMCANIGIMPEPSLH